VFTVSSRTSLVVTGLLLGTGGVLGRLSGLAPMAVARGRLAVGGAVIVACLLVGGRRLPRGWPAWRRIVTVGVLAAGYQGCYFAAMALTSVSVAMLVTIGAFPVLVSAAEHALGRRRVDRRSLTTIAISLAGLALLVGTPAAGRGAGAAAAGTGLALAAAGGFAAVSLLAARPVPGLADLELTGYAFALGGLLLLPAAPLRLSLPAFGWVLVLGLVPTTVAYTLYFRGLRGVPAGTAAVILLLEPLTGTVLATVLLGDRLGPADLAGALLLGVAVVRAATIPGAYRQPIVDDPNAST
jgi:drug/metabolite transporter, DME family